MSKKAETLELEKSLEFLANEKRWYGCEEITIGFYNNGHGNEICDYILMDSKGIIRCYEIKVTKQDLFSHAKKSWYGNYNYLVITEDLLLELSETPSFSWEKCVEKGVGVLVGRDTTNYIHGQPVSIKKFESIVKAKKRDLTEAEQLMLTQSMVRSMMYKIKKYKDSHNLNYIKKLKKDSDYFEKAYNEEHKQLMDIKAILGNIQWNIKQHTGLRFHVEDLKDIFDW